MQLITTLKERCRVCYTCVRDCPAKAIRIHSGQAQVIKERCIGCGNCVRVCSQNAKQVYSTVAEVNELLISDFKVAAILAPSFPAEFRDLEYRQMVGMIRRLGFDLVCEVSYGADLVAAEYKKMVQENECERSIATTCPAIVSYVEKYHPGLTGSLAPIASPMVAMARVLHRLHGDDLKIVFVGPCFAKKTEAFDPQHRDEIDTVLTFGELRDMMVAAEIPAEEDLRSDFDPPHPGLGVLFPISHGMLQASGLQEDLLGGDVIAADGRGEFIQAIKEFESGALNVKLLEVLCCNGCINGPGMSSDAPYYTRRSCVSEYARNRLKDLNHEQGQSYDDQLGDLDLTVNFKMNDCRMPLPSKGEIEHFLAEMGKFKPEDELDCGACGYSTCREHAIAIHKGLAENEMCLPFTIERLKKSLTDLNISNEQLATTQQALINSEKMASMGQLSAGIAHEINNPLGVILLYSKLLMEEMDENSEEFDDLKMIVEQAERCKTIVSGLLNFARKNKVVLVSTNISELIDRCLKAILAPENVSISVKHNLADPMAEVDADQMIQVLTNLIMNAVEAMDSGGKILIATSSTNGTVEIDVEDTGSGIPKKVQKKIFEPLFTTKQMGKGTGLGLAVTYGIVKMHSGKIDFVSNDDPRKGPTGTKFTVSLPRIRPERMTADN